MKLVEELVNYFASNVIPMILQELQIVNEKKGKKQKKNFLPKQTPIVRFLANISKWETPRFQNVAFVDDENKEHTVC